METHPRFIMCAGSKRESHTRFHVMFLFFGGNTRAFPICKGNTVKVSLKIGIIIMEVETHFIHIASFHATGCFECGNTCAFPWVLYFVMGNTCALPWSFWFWIGNTCVFSAFGGVMCVNTCVSGSMPFTGSANFCFCAAAFSGAAMTLQKNYPVEHWKSVMAHVNQNQHKNNLCNFCNLILSFCYWHDLYVHISCYKINIYKLSKFAYVITYVTPCYKSSYIHIL